MLKGLKNAKIFFFFIFFLYCNSIIITNGTFHRQNNLDLGITIKPIAESNIQYETRATWLNAYAFNDVNRRNSTITSLLAANLNTVFLIAPPIGSNRGWSDQPSFNQTLIELKTYNFSVHAWICNLYRTQGKLTDYTNLTEQIAQKDWALLLLEKYPLLDGIHLDYIRYKYNATEPISSTKMQAVMETIEQINQAIKTNYPKKFLTAATWTLSGEIIQSEDEVPEWFQDWFESDTNDDINRWKTPPYEYNGCPLTFTVQQDPATWINNSIIDYCFSMEYSASNSWWCGEVDIWNSFFGGNASRIMMGLGWYIDLWNGTSTNETTVAQRLIDKIRYGQTHNICGFSFFEFGARNNNDSFLIDLLTANSSCPFYFPAKSHLDSSDPLLINNNNTTTSTSSPTTTSPIDSNSKLKEIIILAISISIVSFGVAIIMKKKS